MTIEGDEYSGVMGLPLTPQMRKAVAKRSQGKCEAHIFGVCTYEASEIHHRKLRSRGGSNSLRNLLHCCLECHAAITDMHPGTERYRTHSYDAEGLTEDSTPWQPDDRY